MPNAAPLFCILEITDPYHPQIIKDEDDLPMIFPIRERADDHIDIFLTQGDFLVIRTRGKEDSLFKL